MLRFAWFAGICAFACSGLVAQQPHIPVGFETIYPFAALYGSGGYGSDLVSDGQGGFFGNTIEGGPAVCQDPYGCGTIYHLTQPALPGGPWTESIIYSFAGGADGGYPASVVLGPDGVLYGVTVQGGNAGCQGATCGTAFALSPPATAGAAWTKTITYSFSGNYYTALPSSLIIGPDQVLYGTIPTSEIPCFDQECGSVFSLTPPSVPSDAWTEMIIHSFIGWPDDGISPNASLILGPRGEIYGTTNFGESHPCGEKHVGCGTVFELTPPVSPGGTWTETLLHTFPASPAPNRPQNGVVLGKNGELYGTTPFGGEPGCQDDFGCGAIFKLTPPGSPGGAWTETVLHRFTGGADGAEPYTNLVIGQDGALYGTSAGFDNSAPGTVFLIRNP